MKTTAQVAAELGKSTRYVRKLAEDGRIVGAKKRGRDWTFPSVTRLLTKGKK